MRRKSWLKLFTCKKNLPEASNHSTPTKTTGSEDKRKRISRQTSFQQLCSIIISEAHPDEDFKGIQQSVHTVYHVTEEPDDHLDCSSRLLKQVVSPEDDSSSLEGDHVVVLDDQMHNASQSSSANADSDIEHIILTMTAVEEHTQEYVPAFIQIALKRFLAEKDPGEPRKAAEPRAEMHGHLIRRIHKMKNIFKARNTCLLTAKRLAQKKHSRSSQEAGKYGAKQNQSSMVKLLNKVLAHQLTVSTLEMKPVIYASDAEKPYSLWQWLERWLDHTSSNPQHLRSYNSSEEVSDEDLETSLPAQEIKTVLPDTETPIPFSPNANPGLSAIEHEGYQFHTSSVRMKIQIPLSSIDIEVDSFTINGKDQYGMEDSMTVISNSSQVPSVLAETLDYRRSSSVELETEVSEVSSDTRIFFDCVETEVKSPVRSRSRHDKASDHSKDASMDSTAESFGSALSASHSVEINIEATSLVEDTISDLESTYMTKECTFFYYNGKLNGSKEKMACHTANVEHPSTVTATSNIYKKSAVPTREIDPSPRGSSPRMHVVLQKSQGATSTQLTVSAKISKSENKIPIPQSSIGLYNNGTS